MTKQTKIATRILEREYARALVKHAVGAAPGLSSPAAWGAKPTLANPSTPAAPELPSKLVSAFGQGTSDAFSGIGAGAVGLGNAAVFGVADPIARIGQGLSYGNYKLTGKPGYAHNSAYRGALADSFGENTRAGLFDLMEAGPRAVGYFRNEPTHVEMLRQRQGQTLDPTSRAYFNGANMVFDTATTAAATAPVLGPVASKFPRVTAALAAAPIAYGAGKPLVQMAGNDLRKLQGGNSPSAPPAPQDAAAREHTEDAYLLQSVLNQDRRADNNDYTMSDAMAADPAMANRSAHGLDPTELPDQTEAAQNEAATAPGATFKGAALQPAAPIPAPSGIPKPIPAATPALPKLPEPIAPPPTATAPLPTPAPSPVPVPAPAPAAALAPAPAQPEPAAQPASTAPAAQNSPPGAPAAAAAPPPVKQAPAKPAEIDQAAFQTRWASAKTPEAQKLVIQDIAKSIPPVPEAAAIGAKHVKDGNLNTPEARKFIDDYLGPVGDEYIKSITAQNPNDPTLFGKAQGMWHSVVQSIGPGGMAALGLGVPLALLGMMGGSGIATLLGVLGIGAGGLMAASHGAFGEDGQRMMGQGIDTVGRMLGMNIPAGAQDVDKLVGENAPANIHAEVMNSEPNWQDKIKFLRNADARKDYATTIQSRLKELDSAKQLAGLSEGVAVPWLMHAGRANKQPISAEVARQVYRNAVQTTQMASEKDSPMAKRIAMGQQFVADPDAYVKPYQQAAHSAAELGKMTNAGRLVDLGARGANWAYDKYKNLKW